jgi:methionyl-tRNA formyltransferase
MNTSVLLLTKKNDFYIKEIIKIINENFSMNLVCQGDWGDPLPAEVLSWEGDYIISYLSRWVLSKKILDKARIAAINFHPASPAYPGIGCYNFALYDSALEYGVTCHHMEEKPDTGSIIAVTKFPIVKDDTVESLINKTYKLQFELFKQIMTLIVTNKELPISNGKWFREPYTRKDLEQLSIITQDMPEVEVERRIRAVSYKDWKVVKS